MRIFLLTLTLLLAPVAAATDSEFDYLMGDVEQWQADLKALEQALDFENQRDQNYDQTLVPLADQRDSRVVGALKQNKFSGNLAVTLAGNVTEFTDVPVSAWFAPYVRTAVEQAIFSGYRDAAGQLLGQFGPADPVTIEQMAKITLEASGLNLVQCRGNLPKNEAALLSWSRPYIACAEGFRMVVFSDGGVDLQRPATRSEVVISVIQALNIQFDRPLGTLYTDVGAGVEFAGAIERMSADGIVSGYSDEDGQPTGQFGPADPVTRAEMAKIIALAVQTYGQRLGGR